MDPFAGGERGAFLFVAARDGPLRAENYALASPKTLGDELTVANEFDGLHFEA